MQNGFLFILSLFLSYDPLEVVGNMSHTYMALAIVCMLKEREEGKRGQRNVLKSFQLSCYLKPLAFHTMSCLR